MTGDLFSLPPEEPPDPPRREMSKAEEDNVVRSFRQQLGKHAVVDEPHQQQSCFGYPVPRDLYYPEDSVQCDECGGIGSALDPNDNKAVCSVCGGAGWLPGKNHPGGRRCYNDGCRAPLHPANVAVYCSNDCALDDA